MSGPPARIFLLSHMRAYTSLVGHLLGSHPEIDGYYEMHRSYRFADDLDRQAAQYAAADAPKPGRRYLFDKLLHNDYALDLDALGPIPVAVLASLRQPAPTLRSIVHLFAEKHHDDPYATPVGAAGYYIARLQALAAFGTRYQGRYFYFDAERIRSDTAATLRTLSAWLQLGSPLSPQYRRFSQTGVVGAGDSSPAIGAGRVLDAVNPYADIALDAASLAEAERTYADCRATLIAHAAASLN